MPKVGGKHYAYTKKGKAAAAGSSLFQQDPQYYRGAAVEKAAHDFSEQFKEGWYDPYVEHAMTTPATEMFEGEYTPVSSLGAFSQQMIDAMSPYEVEGGSYAGKAVLPEAAAAGALTARESIYGPTGALAAFQEAKGTAEDVEQEGLEDALEARKREERALDLERIKALRGTLGRQETAEATIGKSGFAYSAPAERAREEALEGQEDTLAGITRQKRGQEKIHEDEKIRLKDDYDAAMREASIDWEGAVADYGSDLKALADTSSGVEDQIATWASDITGAHRTFGEGLSALSRNKLSTGDFGLRHRGVYGKDIFGDRGYGASQLENPGGYFQEEGREAFPAIATLEDDLGRIELLKKHLGQQTTADLGAILGNPEGYVPYDAEGEG